jgi:hypothetical protein
VARARNSLAAASLAITCALVPAFGEELGTLFTTPKERSDLERMRRGESIVPGVSGLPPHEAVITGYVKRSDGKSTVFIDQQPRPVRDAKLQERLVPRVVQRYIPPPPPTPAPVAVPDSANEKVPEAGAARPPAKAND